MKSSLILASTIALPLLVVAALQPQRASAQSTPTQDNPLVRFRGVVEACGQTDSVSTIVCGSYITGIVHGIQATQDATVIEIVADQVMRGAIPPTDSAIDAASKKAREQLQPFCILSNWTAGYVQAVVGQYAREQPQALDDLSADHMLKVFARAFPCAQGE